MAGNNDANFSNSQLTIAKNLGAKSRYELILAGGNAGELIFGDSYAESLLQKSFKTSDWSFNSGSPWRIEADNQKITKMTNQQEKLLILDSSLTNDVDIRAYITGLNNNGEAGFAIRKTQPDQSNPSQEFYYYKAVVYKKLGSLNLSVSVWSSQRGELEKLCDELINNASTSEDGFDFRVNVFGSEMKVILSNQVITTINLKESNLGNPLLIEGKSGLLATTGVNFQKLQIRKSELLKIPFMTSEFNSYGEMIASGHGHITDLAAPKTTTDAAQDLDAVKALMDQLTYQRLRLQTGAVDYNDGSIDRKAFETIQQNHRSAKALLDNSFGELCNSLSGIFYNPLSPYLESYILKTDSGAFGIYVRSPEPLDLKTNVEENLINNDSFGNLNTWRQTGTTDIQLYKDETPLDAPTYFLTNGDGNHLLILLAPSNANVIYFEVGEYILRFIHSRNLRDDARNIDHRYDRPFNSRLGIDTPETAELRWEIN